MELFIQQIFSGIATGGIYALLALSLVVSRLATGQINFAQGEMATFSTFVAWWMMTALGLPYWFVFLATILLSFFGGMVLEITIFKPFERASAFAQITVFIGLLLIFNGLSGWIFDYEPKAFPSSPFADIVLFQNNYLSSHEMGMLFVTLLVAISLGLFFQFTKLGLAMRASYQNPELSSLSGIRIGRLLAVAWGLSAAIAAVAGMLIAPIVFLDPNMMGSILLYAMTAAVLGGTDSMIGAVVGGLLVGIIENLIGTYVPFSGNDLKLPIALLLILIMLLVKPSGLFGKPVYKKL